MNIFKHEHLNTLFPKNKTNKSMGTRNYNHYKVNIAFTQLFRNSSIPFMQQVLSQKKNNMELSKPPHEG